MSDYVAPDFYNQFSLMLSTALDDIGVNMKTVNMRRRLQMALEKVLDIQEKLTYHQTCTAFIFGSQTEGTTTPDLKSDIDMMFCMGYLNVILNWTDWKPDVGNALMLKLPTTAPQHYLLQILYADTPEPITSDDLENVTCWDFILQSGHLVIRSDLALLNVKKSISAFLGMTANTNGPAVTVKMEDLVFAFPVHVVLPEIQCFIERERPGYWPTPQLLDDARHCVNFLVPLGNPLSDDKYLEWRLSTNMIERKLMFSLNVTQIQCYVILKLTKHSLFREYTLNSKGITSYHCKTVLFFTMEKHPLNIWEPHNLLLVVKLCLKTLKCWLKSGVCPHFIIPEVNLFDGKLNTLDRRRLYQCVSSLIKNDLQYIFELKIENLHQRMVAYQIGYIPKDCHTRRRVHIGIWQQLSKSTCFMISRTNILLHATRQNSNTYEYCLGIIRNLHIVMNYDTTDACGQLVMLLVVNFAMATGSASRNHHPSLTLLKYGFQTDIASSRLKFASMLYCKGNMQAVVHVLEDVKRRYKGLITRVCSRKGIYGLRNRSLVELEYCVMFFKKDAYYVPHFLLYDFAKSAFLKNLEYKSPFKNNYVDTFEADPRAFLYYLEYLTYGSLEKRNEQLSALQNLVDRVSDEKSILPHRETAMNMYAHCAEMEGDIELAIEVFTKSRNIRPTNNTACFHIDRLHKTHHANCA